MLFDHRNFLNFSFSLKYIFYIENYDIKNLFWYANKKLRKKMHSLKKQTHPYHIRDP